MNLKKKSKNDFKGRTASARPAEATGTRGLSRLPTVPNAKQLTHCRKKEEKKKKDGVLKQHKDSEERDQTGIFTAVADSSEDNMDRQAFTGV